MSFNPYESPYSDSQTPPSDELPKHSGLGIASFVISLVAGIGVFVAIAAGTAMAMDNAGGVNERSPGILLVGMAVLGGLAACLLGIGLGIGGCIQGNRRTTFAILGLIFNGLIILGVSALMCIGATVS